MLCGFRLQRFHLLSVEVKGSSQAAMLGFYELSERNIPQLREVKVHDANFWHFYIFYLNSLQIFDQPASENQWNWSLWLPVTLKVVKGYSVKQVINGGLGQISRWMPEIVLAWAFNALTKINIKLSKSWSWICSARHLLHRPPPLVPPWPSPPAPHYPFSSTCTNAIVCQGSRPIALLAGLSLHRTWRGLYLKHVHWNNVKSKQAQIKQTMMRYCQRSYCL